MSISNQAFLAFRSIALCNPRIPSAQLFGTAGALQACPQNESYPQWAGPGRTSHTETEAAWTQSVQACSDVPVWAKRTELCNGELVTNLSKTLEHSQLRMGWFFKELWLTFFITCTCYACMHALLKIRKGGLAQIRKGGRTRKQNRNVKNSRHFS